LLCSVLSALIIPRPALFGYLPLSLSMRFVLALIGIMFAFDFLWWVVSARFARPRFARIGIAIFALAQLTGLTWLLTQRFSHAESIAVFSKFVMATVFIWHMIILPLFLLLAVALMPILAMAALIRIARRLGNSDPAPVEASGAMSRRQFLEVALAATPPLFTLCLAAIA